jgi:uncharacterized protein
MINYGLIILIYSPVFILLLISSIRDRFASDKKPFPLQNWSLSLAIGAVMVFITSFIVQSLWSLLPILKNYEYNPFNWEVFSLIYAIFVLVGIYIFLSLIYSVRVVDAFDLRLAHSSVLLKLCAILAALNILSMYTLRINFLGGTGSGTWGAFDSAGLKHFLVYSLNTVIVHPILEESVFRGLLYTPLYKKVGKLIAVVLCSMTWAFVHFHFQSIFPFIGTFLQGVLLGWLYIKSGSLLQPILLHMFLNSWRVMKI